MKAFAHFRWVALAVGTWFFLGPEFVTGQAKAPAALPKAVIWGGEAKAAELVARSLQGKMEVLHRPAAMAWEEMESWLDGQGIRVVAVRVSGDETTEWKKSVAALPAGSPRQAVIVVPDASEDALTEAVRFWAEEAGLPYLDWPGLLKTAQEQEAVETAALADSLLRHWIVTNFSAQPPVDDGKSEEEKKAERAEAGRRYREREAEQDALVPEMYKQLPIGRFSLPGSAGEWEQQRPGVLEVVKQSLGDLPPRPENPEITVVSRERRPGYTLERVWIPNGVGNDISALVLIPDQRAERAPAILWLHSSTPDKNAVIMPDGGGTTSLGEEFVKRGYVVLAPDAWYYGDRADKVPSGPRDIYRRGVPPHAQYAQDTLLKINLWLGRTHWGMMVRDDQIALDYLAQRPEVDAARIGVTGMSMGSTRSWWLAALDERVAATVGVACLTRYENLIHHGTLRSHGLYYFSYGLLKHFDTEGVISLIAPRPFLALTGDLDYGSPVDGIREIEKAAGSVYRTLGAEDAFRSVVYEDTGHVYTPEMRAEMLTWMDQWLQPQAP